MNSIIPKIRKSREIIDQAYRKFPVDKLALAWTGGKDSNLLLWIVRQYAQDCDLPLPQIIFINEGDVFEEMWDFTKNLSSQWEFEYRLLQNDDVLDKVGGLGKRLIVADLSDRNQTELERLGFKEESFIFEPESFVGNHLMKTVPLKLFVEEEGIKALITGIRWDEQEARANEIYFSPREDPPHERVHPLLHFEEADVWKATHHFKIPYVSLYEKGYRSLGARASTTRAGDRPAWEQDLEKTAERVGRAQDKEKIMARLRSLGYM